LKESDQLLAVGNQLICTENKKRFEIVSFNKILE